jgi:putative transposase
VSRLVEEIDGWVNAFLARPLEGEWPYLGINPTYVKARDGRRIVSTATIVAVGVNTDEPTRGARRCHGSFRGRDVLERLPALLADRGLRGVKLVIADDHKGPRAAASKVFHATLQRCRVHWVRNALAHVGQAAPRP